MTGTNFQWFQRSPPAAVLSNREELGILIDFSAFCDAEESGLNLSFWS